MATTDTDIPLMPMTIRRIVDALETLAPLAYQEDYDNAGLQVGLIDDEVTGVLLCLDITEDIIDEAVRKGCNLVVSHHPLIFRPLRHVTGSTYQELLQQKRLQRAAELLTGSSLSASDIAMAVGYENISFFHRLFRKAYGTTPRRYRVSEGISS